MTKKFKLTFLDWQDTNFNSIYNTQVGILLSDGDLHSGSTFECEIKFDEDTLEDIESALSSKFRPVFYISS